MHLEVTFFSTGFDPAVTVAAGSDVGDSDRRSSPPLSDIVAIRARRLAWLGG